MFVYVGPTSWLSLNVVHHSVWASFIESIVGVIYGKTFILLVYQEFTMKFAGRMQ